MRRRVAILVKGSKRFVKYDLSRLALFALSGKEGFSGFTYQPSKCVVLEHGGN